MTLLPRNTMAVILFDLLQLKAVHDEDCFDDIERCVREHPIHAGTRSNGRTTEIYADTHGLAEWVTEQIASVYVSTGCFHGSHGHCRSDTRIDGGTKEPARCKFCPALCICPCHRDGDDLSGVDLSVYRHRAYVQHERSTEGETA